ncbi:MAG: hypothetical protein P8185_24795 [Deltaproteobacteria bacterium]|jgi:hypothetical protein
MSAQEYFPQDHPLKEKFREYKFPQVAVRNFLRQHLKIQISTSRLAQFLNGYDNLPANIEDALNGLADQLAQERRAS